MDEELFKNVLCYIASQLDKNNVNWALIGSFNLHLQGIDILVHDMYILVSCHDQEKIKNIFSEHSIVNEHKLSNNEGEETEYLINNISVKFCFEYDNGFYIKRLGGAIIKDNLNLKVLDNQKIYCFKLTDEIEAYKYLGREEKVKIISNFVQNAISK